jgi:SAM-dependent methyltransferase
MNKSLEDIILELVGLFRPHIEGLKSVIDIGTGTSIPIHVFAELFPEIRYQTVDVVDIRQRKKLPFILYDGSRLPFDDSEFDVSLLNETLHHCDQPENVLNEAKRVAETIFVIEHFPNQDTSVEELVKTEIYALINFNLNCQLYNPFTEESLNLLFEKAELTILEKIEIPYYGEREIKKYFFKLGFGIHDGKKRQERN